MFLPLLLVAVMSMQGIQHPAQKAESLTSTEAQILVYLLPECKATRKEGFECGMELEIGPAYNQADYYTFSVYNATRKCEACSVTIGFFSVNKHTAEVIEMDSGARTSQE